MQKIFILYEKNNNKMRGNKMDNIGLEMFKMWKTSWENYVKTLSTMQGQGEKMLDVIFTQSHTSQQETVKLIKEGMAKAQEAQKSYFQIVEENFDKIEELLSKSV
jgi:hypothetical protein